MHLEHKPLHTSRSGDTILPLLGHTLGLKKIFFLVLLFFMTHQSLFHPMLLRRWSLEHKVVEYCQCSWNHKPISVHYLLGMSHSLWRFLWLRGVSHLAAWLPRSWLVTGGGSTSLKWMPAQAALQHLWRDVNTWESSSIPTPKVLNLSGLTTPIPGYYLDATFTSSHITVKIVNTYLWISKQRKKRS